MNILKHLLSSFFLIHVSGFAGNFDFISDRVYYQDFEASFLNFSQIPSFDESFGSAGSLENSSSRLDISSLNLYSGDFTFSTWILCREKISTYNSPIGFFTGGPGTWQFLLGEAPDLNFSVAKRGGEIQRIAQKILEKDKFYFLAVSLKHDIITVLINGELVLSTPIDPEFQSNNLLTILDLGSAASYSYFNGAFDNFSLFNRALTNTELEALYQYESNPSSSRLRRATAEAEIVNGFVVGVNLLYSGYGYTDPPEVTLLDSQGTGAEVVSVVEDGRVVGFEILNTGRGYSANTIVQIAPPLFAPEMSIRVKSIELNLHLVVGKSYVIEATNDFILWTPVSEPFVADNEFMAFEYEVGAHGKYYRVVEEP